MENIAIQVKNLSVVYESKKNIFGDLKKIYALNNISLDVEKGEILAVAGESGCGKSTLAKALMKLIPINSGTIDINGITDKENFYKKIQMIFQNPYSSLNPKMKIDEILKEPLEINTNYSKSEIEKIVKEKISKVELDETVLKQYPHEFSGGQRQRIAIARALVLNPEIIIADEPVSALDVSIQAQIINLLKELKQDFNLTFLFISHDLSVIKYISDRIAIMYLGEIAEIGKTNEIFDNPKHPYTQALLSAAPEINKQSDKIKLQGELPSPENLPQGCKFHTRCPFVKDICKIQAPTKTDFTKTHSCSCHLYSEIS